MGAAGNGQPKSCAYCAGDGRGRRGGDRLPEGVDVGYPLRWRERSRTASSRLPWPPCSPALPGPWPRLSLDCAGKARARSGPRDAGGLPLASTRLIRYTLLERSRPHLTGDTPASDGGSRRARGVRQNGGLALVSMSGTPPRWDARAGNCSDRPACVDKVALPAVASGPYGPRYRAHDPVHDPAGVPLHGTPSGIGRAPDDERDPLTPSSS